MPRAGQVLAPGRELLLALDREREVVRRAAADDALLEVGVLEAGDQRAGPALLVAEEEVARAAVVLVHRLLDEPHAEQVAVEADRALHVARRAA